MKRYGILVIGLLAAIVAAVSAWADTGTVTFAYMESIGAPCKATVTWCNTNASTAYNALTASKATKQLHGTIDRFVLLSATATGLTITATVKDADGIDLLQGLGAAILTNGLPTSITPGVACKAFADGVTNAVPIRFNSPLTVEISNFGVTNTTTSYSGSGVLYWTP